MKLQISFWLNWSVLKSWCFGCFSLLRRRIYTKCKLFVYLMKRNTWKWIVIRPYLYGNELENSVLNVKNKEGWRERFKQRRKHLPCVCVCVCAQWILNKDTLKGKHSPEVLICSVSLFRCHGLLSHLLFSLPLLICLYSTHPAPFCLPPSFFFPLLASALETL